MQKHIAMLLIYLCIYPLCAQQFIQLEDGAGLPDLNTMSALDVDQLECSPQLTEINKSMQTWQEILSNQDQLESDINSLVQVHSSIRELKLQNYSPHVLLQVRESHTQILTELLESTNELTPYQKWRKAGMDKIKGQLSLLDETKDPEQNQECCEQVEMVIDKLLKERHQIQDQCKTPAVTINIINTKADKVQASEQVCQGDGLAIKTIPDTEKKFTKGEAPEDSKVQESTESELSEEEDEEDKDPETDNKPHPSDFTKNEPIKEKEEEDKESPFKEYGYGFWVRFMVAYPKRLPNGKDAPWYFVARLTSNKKYDNIGMGDRILALWLGKGFYHFTTCDAAKSNPNVAANINYPSDIDGLWTYVYYSYSAEHKKAVAFIKFGDTEEPIKTITNQATNPETKYLKFILGGTDAQRYPAFNGVITSVYFSTKPGAFRDNEDEIEGLLQSQKKQPQQVVASLLSYKLVGQPITRDPKTNEQHQVVGGAKPRFPHEYAFSGWFKWTPLANQEEWHNAFRVQITTPSTDKFLGDRTLSMWVGKSGGILHLPTYTYTTMEGAGNNNAFKNIPHKDQHTKWFFVYFGYSKPQQNAYAFVKFADDEASQDYENINHYTVAKFYVFIGKDKHFSGFNGQIAHAAFTVGEGAFRKSNDFKKKNDPFRFALGAKQLLGKKPTDEESKSEEVDDGVIHTSSTEENKPKVDEQVDDIEDLSEYGYGFWARYLTLYPQRMANGISAPYYFVSRLTVNKNYGNIEMGDRTLAIWQAQGGYLYITCNTVNKNPNVVANMVYPNDIEGVWTFFYYSYSIAEKKAIGFAKYGNQEPRMIEQAVTHPTSKYLRFILGGKDANRYPGFNGLFSQVHFSQKEGAFIDTIEEVNDYIKRSLIPTHDLSQVFKHELVDNQITRKPTDAPDYDEIGGGQQKFPHEYAISGWFKWQPATQAEWHNVFRVQIKKPSTDQFLGDRTLSLWVGKSQGILHFPTYTYTSMSGQGNANIVKNILHKNRHVEWFFVYYGYSKNDKKAFVAVRFNNAIETIEYTGINHYYTPKFYSYVGKDQHFSGFSGKVAYVNFALGDGAFRSAPNFKHPEDLFGLAQGESALLKKPITKPDVVVDKETGDKHIPNAVNDNKAKVNEEFNSEQPLKEYGYGYWARFLTTYPVRLYKGKNAAWYFMSRMSTNQKYGNVGMGDRALAIWQAQGSYLFTTCNTSPSQPNLYKKINSPADIEGLWTYIYYSHSVDKKKSVGFIKYGDQKPEEVSFTVTHPTTKYIRFTLGGKDSNTYPGFNGQFTQMVYSATPGVFIESLGQFNELVAKKPSPATAPQPLQTTKLVDSQVSRGMNTAPAVENVQVLFPKEYAFSGWFKWEPTAQKVWHNAFRVQIQKPSTDRFLGDRTLAMWVGTGAGGILHISTYSYKNMNGGGDANMPQNIVHKNRHLNWFFVYFGYSKNDKHGNAYVKWTGSEDSLEFKNINHYFSSQFFVFAGKDNHFPGFNGKVAYISFNTGEGSYRKGTDFTHPNDIFRTEKGQSNLTPKDDKAVQAGEEKGELTSAFNNNAPSVDKQLNSSENLVEYGYGFWSRFLTAYPERLIYGKNAPWYFVSRMTVNQQYDNIRMGDRALAIWQGQGYYHFTTCNSLNNQVNVVQNINYPADIEGVWTYVYYSYSSTARKAVAYIKFGKDDAKTIVHQVLHPASKAVRFILGGMDNNRYPAFNGLFTQVMYSANKGVFIDNVQSFNAAWAKVPSTLVPLKVNKLIADLLERKPETAPNHQTIGDENTKLPEQYALSGWFIWEPTKQQVWHNAFRVQIKSPSTDRFLGDRTLSMWVGTPQGGILHFPTYTYTNMNGAGNANLVQNIVHKDRHNEWFFVYFGYSKNDKTAYAFVKWSDSEDSLTYGNCNHYLAHKFFVFVGKDAQFPGFSGKVAYTNFVLGDGSFRKGKDFTDDGDSFGFGLGVKELFKPVKPEPVPEPEKLVHESKSVDATPKFDKSNAVAADNLVEYGYGYWFRFLSAYPHRLLKGKNEAWYFMSRLTVHQEYDNIRMGDRTLAMWQGQGSYIFVTCNTENNQANVVSGVNYPEDIEGVWTYAYYSYSVKEKQAVGFMKFGEGDFQQVTQKVTNPLTKQVRFIVGGNDEKRYPAFNGLIQRIYFNTKPGAYINSVAAVVKFLADQGPVPASGLTELITEAITEDEITRVIADEPIEKAVTEKKLPQEYSLSGWFRWKPVAQAAWHNVFRVSIKTPSTDAFLGDRTLSCWVGTPDGGILHFPTYTYTNMNGGGNSNLYKNIVHKNRHHEWFFVYFGYSKPQSLAKVYVKWSDSEDNLEYVGTKHYLVSEFFIFVGKDKHFPGMSGKIANVKFNMGEGAFKKDADFTHPKDAFGHKAGLEKYHKKEDDSKKEPVDRPAEKAILDNSFDDKAPKVDKKIEGDKFLTSYGYGFWARFLTVHPKRLFSGKNAPWYFVSRLTQNKEYDNIRMNDRNLAIWQGQGYYHFTTCNQADGNVNVIQNQNYPDDIEGVWTFIYYSYSDEVREAVGIIKFGDAAPKAVTHKVTHSSTKLVRFILGGTDEGRYPGFNGQFTSVTFLSDNAFIRTVDEFTQHLKQVGAPQVDSSNLVNTQIVEEPISRNPGDEPTKYLVAGGGENKFPKEYAISGWFKWRNCAQQAWHNLFRVQVKTPSTDNFLGDRTLTLWIGTSDGGILHFPTYTYTNMNAAGNANYYKNIAHKNRHTEWFFVYFGYSKKEASAYSFVKWTETDDSLTYEKTNHYLAPEFYVFVGRDKQFVGHSGSIAHVNFNAGEGAFKNGKDFAHPQDAFGWTAGQEMIKKQEQSKPEPGESDKTILSNSFEQKKPVVDTEGKAESDLEEYGYGFWARFMTAYPLRLLAGKNAPWYFVARLTANKEYDNIRMSDRTLAIWQGQGYYHFTTCNAANGNVNTIQNVNYPEDIEGVWTYVYYSYSDHKQKAIALIKFNNEETKVATHLVTHPRTKFVRFILGGNDENRYPGFNGLFTRVSFSAKKGAFMENPEQLATYLTEIGKPTLAVTQQVIHKLVEEKITRDDNAEPLYKQFGSEEERFPFEYAISGFFKWVPTAQKPWHNIFRVQIKTPSTDNFLGDRTLTCWLGSAGILHFPTYTYTNMNGAGNANLHQNINHKDKHKEWFFVYFGYSKKDAKAYIYVKWTDSEDSLTYEKVNHYFAAEFFVFVGRDKQFPGLNGQLGYVNFNVGAGSFRTGNNFGHSKDAFGYSAGLENLINKQPVPFSPAEPEKGVKESAHDNDKPALDKDASSDKELEEYGYGFWARFLTVYPARLLAGKNQAWYFVSRLTANKEYDNVKMNDRTLAIWQGQGYYHFTTCNKATNNVNQVANINYPADIEGVWTFIYYSYSVEAGKAVAFIKYGDSELQSITHQTQHQRTKFVRFILGGTDEKRYPAFNGLFTTVTLSTKAGAFVDSAKDIIAYLAKNAAPSVTLNELVTDKVVKDPIQRATDDEPLYKVSGGEDNKFPHEYAISGWFKWTPVAQKPWHNIFRVSIKNPSTDSFLGDRTLTCWLGAGILHFPTYTYTNMNAAGNANHVQNINHKDRHTKWFFVYFGYQKSSATAYIFVKWHDSEDSLTYEKINHYYTPEFFLYVGKDKHFPGFNGKLGFVNFNIGQAAFNKVTDFTAPKDVFAFKAGADALKTGPAPFKPSEADKAIKENAHDSVKPVSDSEKSDDDYLEEYGYGFWARFLTVYPTRLISGKNAPWYFVARLTANKEYDNIRMNDRTLAIWQGQGYYHFTTCNAATNNVNQIANINYPADIEGVWTYIYYSYSADANKAVAFIKYGDTDIQQAVHATTHANTKFVRFILGGNDEKRYPGFNGLFTSVTFSTKTGAYVGEAKELATYLTSNPAPSVIQKELTNNNVVKDIISRNMDNEPAYKVVGGDNKFPHEYAISGWFKWSTIAQRPWHNIFRVAIKTPSTDQFLGDRTLTCWLGAGILHFPTYTYTNMNAAGNANHHANINHKDRHTQWFFVYFGYQKKTATAYIYVKWFNSEDSLNYEKINHYYTPEFFLYIGRDKHFPGFNGQIGYVNFNQGEGAFRKGIDFNHPKDVFGFDAEHLKRPAIELDLAKDAQDKTFDSPHDSKTSVLEKEFEEFDLNKVSEYGYGFWCRFLTHYPAQLVIGKRQPWYFIARLTKNKILNDQGVGDRTLALWQGQGNYHFTSYSGNNPYTIYDINSPNDIEGLWTFIYYSHSLTKKQSVSFVKFGAGDIVKNVQAAIHTTPEYMKFYLGGRNTGYPAYNGQFSQVMVSAGKGVFQDEVVGITKLLETLKQPADFNTNLVTKEVIPKSETYKADSKQEEKVFDDFQLVGEYAWSGWFKWTPISMAAWHLGVRLAILQNSENMSYLGDRTLCMWVGSADGGILHFTTYSYTNMLGAGNVNQVQNIHYKNDLAKWHYVHYGYSKLDKLARASVEFKSRKEIKEFKDTNHFLPNKFSIYVAKDKWHAAYSGDIAYLRFNGGQGAFAKDGYDKNDKDIFGYLIGAKELVKPSPVFDAKKRDGKVIDSPFDSKEPLMHKVFTDAEMADLSEYGYGYWFRYMTRYPFELKTGFTMDWMIMSRLTRNKVLGDQGLGDRTLALWQSRTFYYFSTCHGGNVNAVVMPPVVGDMEGRWNFLWYSHSMEENKNIGYLKQGDEPLLRFEQAASQPLPTFLQFYLAGGYGYPSYNGQFADVMVSTGLGVYIKTAVEIENLMKILVKPADYNTKIVTKEVVGKTQQFKGDIAAKEIFYNDVQLVAEYAWSGWFKWIPTAQQPWHLMVRLATLQGSENMSYQGDRTLNAWVGKGYFHFTCYSYTNIYGAGNVNQWQNMNYEGDLVRWHFIYFGYSRPERLAYAKVLFRDRTADLTFKGTNHFLPNKFALSLGKDKWHSTYSGNMAHVKFNGGNGVFMKEKFEDAPEDILGYKAGKELEPPSVDPPVDPLRDQEIIDSALTMKTPIDKTYEKADLGEDLAEYGFGCYTRFLFQYPVQNHKLPIVPFSIFRVTRNREWTDMVMGDRVFGNWLGNNVFLFRTHDVTTNRVDVVMDVPLGTEHEGVWMFQYISYSRDEQKVVVLVKSDASTTIHRLEAKVGHGTIELLRLLIGGSIKPYSGFSGQIANYVLKLGAGAFANNYENWKKHLDNRVPHPLPDNQKFQSVKITKGQKKYKAAESKPEVIIIEDEARFAGEESVSGWVRWDVPTVPPFYCVWRLSFYEEAVNADAAKLGDRDLSLFKQSTYYIFVTYHADNMYGYGNANLNTNIAHTDNYQQWHFIYFGGSKKNRQTYNFIQFVDGPKEVKTDNQRRFLVNRHVFTLGTDFPKWVNSYRTIDASVAGIQINYGDGAYQLKPFQPNEGKPDIFGFAGGQKDLFPTYELKVVGTEKDKLIEAACSSDKMSYEYSIEDGQDYEIRGGTEYGFAFWTRFTRLAPAPQIWKNDWHIMGKVGTTKGDKLPRWLTSFVGRSKYHFATNSPSWAAGIDIPYKKIEGEWNFISFTYKQSKLKAIIWFSESEIKEGQNTYNLPPLKDFIQFSIGTEKGGYCNFNGHFLNVQFRVGKGAFIDMDTFKHVANVETGLPDKFRYKQERKAIALIKEKKRIAFEDKVDEIVIKPEDVEGRKEYAISGWARWSDPPAAQAWNILFRVTTNTADYGNNAHMPGDRALCIWKGPGYYHFNTYTVNEENGGTWAIAQNSDYQGNLYKTWAFFYLGYSKDKQAVHAYVKYSTKEDHLHFANINHLTAYKFMVQMHYDRWHPAYSGFYEAWYFNTGVGSYKEKDYGKNENDDITFGFGGRTITPLKPWSHKEMFDSWWNPEWVVGKDIEYTDDSINGLTEYAYGMWTRFAWNGPKLMVNKPTWSALSRLTTNHNYQGDAGQPGDRCLAIWVGPGYYHFTTSIPGNSNVWTNINYDQMLDGQWNYIYFGYKKTKEGGKVQGHVIFDGAGVRSTNYGNLVHPAVSDYLYFVAGSSGVKLLKNYHSFNGKYAQVQLLLGDGAFQDSVDDVRKLMGKKPAFPEIKEIRKTILEEQTIMKRSESTVDPVEFKEEEDKYEFEGVTEYSVSIWYKWSTIGRVAWENIYTLTYMDPKNRANHAKPGDRVLSMFQYADHRTFFSSYTTPGNHDGFAGIATECPVPALDQNSWVYGYYAYSREANSVISYLKTRSTNCEKKLAAMHRTPQYFGLYVGKDGIHTPYNGRFAHMYLYAGPGSYREKELQQFAPYIVGAEGIQPKPFRWQEKKGFINQAFDQAIDVELDPEQTDGHSAYGYGFWVKYLTAIPKRLVKKPQWLELSRLTINKDNKDMSTTGDRTLAIWVGQGYYHFTTYNQAANQANLVQNIDYGTSLEGIWNFIYFSYSSSKQSAVGMVKFGDTEEVKRIAFNKISHRPIEMYCKIHIGKEFSYQGFNGQISQFQVLFGGSGYVHDVDSLETIIKAFFTKPIDKQVAAVKVDIQEKSVDKKVGDAAQITEWKDEYEGSMEYCIFGWFRYSAAQLAKPNNVFLRLTNNEAPYRGEYQTVGDRTLLIMYQPREVVFATYSLGKVDSGLINNIRKPTPVGNNHGLWTYVYFGYSWIRKQAGGVAKFPSGMQAVPYDDVLHMVPKYLAMYAGSDGMLGGWNGPMAKVGAIFGKGAYIDPTKGNVENLLPEYKGWNSNPTAEWKPEKDEIELVPKGDKPGYDIEFKEQVSGMSTYGYGLWARWLMTTPNRIVEKSPFHQFVRLTDSVKYEDNNEFGNRVLATWAGKGYYHFTTYDKATNKVSIHQNINYDDYLEGHWNYIYFSYTTVGKPRAVGFVLFGDVASESVSRVEFPGPEHNPLNGYARVVVANKEFTYPPFNGMISKFRVYFGKGFIGSKEQLLKEAIASYPKPSLQLPQRTDIKVLKDNTVFSKGKEGVMKSFDQYQGVLEYAVSGWFQFRATDPEQMQTIFRLTINAPELLKDKNTAGDRTLSCFAKKDKYEFSTYDYGNLDTNDDDKNDLSTDMAIGESKGEWTFVYFGYSSVSRKAFAYTLFVTKENSYQFTDLKHFIPNKFWLYLAQDKFYPTFDGVLYDWNLYLGDGSFTMKPRGFIEIWPYEPKDFDTDKVKSALLGNQGLNSVRIIKDVPHSGVIGKLDGPASGRVESADGPKSGSTGQAPNPNSGTLSNGDARSGAFTVGNGAQSGQVGSGSQAQSGQVNSGSQAQSGKVGSGDQANSGQVNQGEQAGSGELKKK